MKKEKPDPSGQKRLPMDCVKTVLILFLCTLAASGLDSFGIQDLNIILTYLIGILIITIETKGYLLGMLASLISILLFNYFFTEPRGTLSVYNANYLVSFLLFLVVAFITSTLVSKLQQHIILTKYSEEHTRLLYKISLGYLNISGTDSILNYGVDTLCSIQCHPVILYAAKSLNELDNPRFKKECMPKELELENDTIPKWCLSNVVPCGFGTSFFSNSKWRYLPIKSSSRIQGVAGFYCGDTDISEDESVFITTCLSQLALTLEREQLHLQEETIRVEMEKEQLESSILRSISHDLRTPLTGIEGSSAFMLDNLEKLDQNRIQQLLSNINEDAVWLTRLLENLLSSTRINDGMLQLSKEEHVVDDVVYEALSRVKKRLNDHKLSFHIPSDTVTAQMDGELIVQVLVNLIDNSIKHTPEDSNINLDVEKEDHLLRFTVSDNGTGIDPSIRERVFDRFITANPSNQEDERQGVGLGLYICKSVITAHGGEITAENTPQGGASFSFTIPWGVPVRS